ncbi:MAG: synaptobrevin family protein [archaeon]|nr:synaptobrevin family protein [archaeon]
MSSILHFSIYYKEQKIKLAQLNSDKSKDIYNKIKSELPSILNSTNPDKIEFQKYYLTYLTKEGFLYLCVTKMTSGGSLPERFLDQAVTAIHPKVDISSIPKIKELILQGDLEDPINEVVNNFDTGLNQSGDKIQKIQQEVDATKEVMKENIKKTCEEQDNLQELLVKSNDLKQDSKEFEHKTEEVKEATKFYRTAWFYITVIVVTLVIIYFIAALIRCKSVNLFCSK